jgi:hypothetical protein
LKKKEWKEGDRKREWEGRKKRRRKKRKKLWYSVKFI